MKSSEYLPTASTDVSKRLKKLPLYNSITYPQTALGGHHKSFPKKELSLKSGVLSQVQRTSTSEMRGADSARSSHALPTNPSPDEYRASAVAYSTNSFRGSKGSKKSKQKTYPKNGLTFSYPVKELIH